MSIHTERLARLADALRDEPFSAVALNASPTLAYLTGAPFHLSERPVLFFFGASEKPIFVLPAMEAGHLGKMAFDYDAFTYTEDPTTWKPAFHKGLRASGVAGGTLGVEPRQLRYLELSFLEHDGDTPEYVNAEDCVASLRMHKDADEIAQMRKAVQIAQNAVNDTIVQIKEGITERALAAELTANILRYGGDTQLPFNPLVSFGPNSADPHASPSDYEIQEGDIVLIDWGAYFKGYCSDLTRMFTYGEVDPELVEVAEIVKEANLAAQRASGPGVPAGEIDKAARGVITKAGYGPRFLHRTGHGLGREVHEEPYIRGDNQQRLAPGMTFTIEPGVYLDGKGGIRIEDDMLVTEDGAESLSDVTRDLRPAGK